MIITVDDARQYSLSNPVLYTPPVSKPITKSTTPQYISSSPVTSSSTLNKTTLVIVLVVPGVALLILIIVVIIVMICCYCWRKKSQTKQPPEDDNGNTASGEVDEICVKNPLYRDSKLDPPLDYTPTVPSKTGVDDAATNPVLKRVQKQSGVYNSPNQGIGQQRSNISRHDKSIKGDYTPRIYNDTLSDQVRTRQAMAQSGMYTGTITLGCVESPDNQISNIQGYSEKHHISPAHSADGSYRTANAYGPALNVTLPDSSDGEFQYKQKPDYKSNSQPQSKVNSFPPVIHKLEHKNVKHPAMPHIPEMDHASTVSASEASDDIYDAIDDDAVEDESSDDYDDALTLKPAISPGVKPAAYFYGGDHASKDGHLGRGLAVHDDGGIYEELDNLPNPPPIPVVRTPVTEDVHQDNQVGDDDAIYQVDAVADEDDIYQDGAVAEEDDIYNDDAVANTTVPIRRWDRFQSAEDEAIARSSLFQQEKTDEVSTSIASIMASPNNTRQQQFFFHTAATHRKGSNPWM